MSEGYDNGSANYYKAISMKRIKNDETSTSSGNTVPDCKRNVPLPSIQTLSTAVDYDDAINTQENSYDQTYLDHTNNEKQENLGKQRKRKSRLIIGLIVLVVVFAAGCLVFAILNFTSGPENETAGNPTDPTAKTTTSNIVFPTTSKTPDPTTSPTTTLMSSTQNIITSEFPTTVTTTVVPSTTNKKTTSAITTQSTTTSVDPKPPIGTFYNPASSCIQLRYLGLSEGIYFIQLQSRPFEVFCDMTTEGGGWTLVATVNQNTFDLSVNYDDTWFLDAVSDDPQLRDFQNWANEYIFGSIDTCTVYDYKNQAYFESKGVDVMVRHVPNQTPVEVSRETSFLQYQTENGFMKNYGGNLHRIFNHHYPLVPTDFIYPDVNSILDRLAARTSEIINFIPDFYFYEYGTDPNELRDGGNGMYEPSGMRILLDYNQNCLPSSYDCYQSYWNYGSPYTCNIGNTIWSSRKTHPFFALIAVGNFDKCFEYFHFEVFSYRPSTDDKIAYTGNHVNKNFQMNYDARCRYGMTSPSVCDVMFHVSNPTDWKSSGAPYADPYEYSTYYFVRLRSYDPMSNLLVGYTMFSRKAGVLITEAEVRNAMSKILQIISESTEFCPDCVNDDVLSVPVQFSIGTSSEVDSMLPPSVKPLPTGFIQFRAYGSSGNVYAMCPAVKVNDWRSKFVCIGETKNPNNPSLIDCNDFTRWSGNPSTVIDEKTPVDFAHLRRDLNSTIMIFYR